MTLREKIISKLNEIEARYPEDLFPEEGTSLDCAGARFARNIIKQIRDEVAALTEGNPEYTPAELAKMFSLSSSGIHERLHHAFCPKSRRREGPTKRLISVELTPELREFLSQERSQGVMLRKTHAVC